MAKSSGITHSKNQSGNSSLCLGRNLMSLKSSTNLLYIGYSLSSPISLAHCLGFLLDVMIMIRLSKVMFPPLISHFIGPVLIKHFNCCTVCCPNDVLIVHGSSIHTIG